MLHHCFDNGFMKRSCLTTDVKRNIIATGAALVGFMAFKIADLFGELERYEYYLSFFCFVLCLGIITWFLLSKQGLCADVSYF